MLEVKCYTYTGSLYSPGSEIGCIWPCIIINQYGPKCCSRQGNIILLFLVTQNLNFRATSLIATNQKIMIREPYATAGGSVPAFLICCGSCETYNPYLVRCHGPGSRAGVIRHISIPSYISPDSVS